MGREGSRNCRAKDFPGRAVGIDVSRVEQIDANLIASPITEQLIEINYQFMIINS
jgi:hypothetical protein